MVLSNIIRRSAIDVIKDVTNLTSGGGGVSPSTVTFYDADGTGYTSSLTLLDADSTGYTVTNTFLDSDGTGYTI